MNIKNKKKETPISKDLEGMGLRILTDLRRISRALDLNSKRLASESNLTSPQIVSLLAIYHKGPLTLAKLAEEVHLSSSTMVGIIDRLETKHLVIRERSKTDRRQVTICITDKGRIAAKNSPLPLQENLIESFSKLSEAQQKNLSKALELLVKLLDVNEAKNLSTSDLS